MLALAGSRVTARLGAAPTTAPAVPVYIGDPGDVALRPSDLGTDWVVDREARSPANQYSSGILFRTLQNTKSKEQVNVWVEVYLAVATPARIAPQQGWNESSGGVNAVCEASRVEQADSGVRVDCRVRNVTLFLPEVPDVVRATALFSVMAERVKLAARSNSPPI